MGALRSPVTRATRRPALRPTAGVGGRFNPVKHFGTDLLWHFGTPDDWWQAFQRALGPELVVNGGFDGDVSGWTGQVGGAVSWSAGELVVTGNGATLARASTPVPTTPGRMHVMYASMRTGTAASGNLASAASSNADLTASFGYLDVGRPAAMLRSSLLFTATAATTYVGVVNNAVAAGTFFADNISVREIDLSKIQLWQDPAGTLPVTGPGQTWGLLLDAKDGLARGVELAAAAYATPAGIDSVTTITSATAFTQTAGTVPPRTYLNLATAEGKWYEVSFKYNTGTGTVALLVKSSSAGIGTTLTQSPSISAGAKTVQYKFLAVNATTSLMWLKNIVSDSEVTEISVKEIPGYHASQAGAPSRPLFTCRYNKMLTTAGSYSLGVGTNASFMGAYSGVEDVFLVEKTTAVANNGYLNFGTFVSTAGTNYKAKFKATANTSWQWTVGISLSIDAAGVVSTLVYSAALTNGWSMSYTVTPIAGGWYEVDIDIVALTAQTGALWIGNMQGVAAVPTTPCYFGELDFRLSIHANTGKPYQRVTSATDMDTEGFPFYSLTDGIDDWASTPVIPLGTMGVSAITVVSGVTKLSDAAGSIVLEIGNAGTTNGSLYLAAPAVPGSAQYSVASKGSFSTSTAHAGGYTAPHKAAVLVEGSVPGDISRIAVNVDPSASNSADQGTGTYTDQIMYMFRRGGTTSPFGGHWHGATGIKRLCTDSEKRRLSSYYNRNVRGY